MSKYRTKHYIRKEEAKKQLTASGYKAISAYRCTRVDLFILLTIACNKINPQHPETEFDNLKQIKENFARGSQARPSMWNTVKQGLSVMQDVEAGSRENEKTYLTDSGEVKA